MSSGCWRQSSVSETDRASFSMEPIVLLEERIIQSKQTFRFHQYYDIVRQGDGTEASRAVGWGQRASVSPC